MMRGQVVLSTTVMLAAGVASTGACGSGSSARGTRAPARVPAAAAVSAAADAYIEVLLRQDNTFARGAGLHDRDGEPMAVGEDAVQAQLRAARDHLRATMGMDDPRVPDPARLDIQLTRLRAEQVIFTYEERQAHRRIMHYGDLFDVSGYVNRDYGPLAVRARAVVEHLERATARVERMLPMLAPEQPRTHLETARAIFEGSAEYLQQDVERALAPALAQDTALRARFDAARAGAVAALGRISRWMDDAKPRANDDFRLGEARLLRLLRVNEGLGLPLAELRRMADEDFRANRAWLEQLAQEMAPGQRVEKVIATVAADRVPADRVLQTATEQLQTLRDFIAARDIITIPGDDVARVETTPPFMRTNSAFLDSPGPFESARVSYYYITPPDPAWAREMQEAYLPFAADLMATSIHEVYPGHFVHAAHLQRAASRAQKLLPSYAFTEGWAHYAEQMMLDAGLGADDPRMRVGQLTNALLRNCRFLAALGLHVDGMSVEAAQQMFMDKCFVDAGNARQQAFRGTYDPGYFSYTLGKLQVLALREKFAARRGSTSLRAFHDWVMSFGGAPLALVEQRL